MDTVAKSPHISHDTHDQQHGSIVLAESVRNQVIEQFSAHAVP